jgi:hypothetical protein
VIRNHTCLAVYLADAKGGYAGTLWVAGGNARYYRNLPDALIDAGYEIRVDAAVEHLRDSPSEVRVPLASTNAGKPQPGKQCIRALTFQLR